MIHGHTHKPADHDLGAGLQRVVLSDWDVQARPPRAEVLRRGGKAVQQAEVRGPLPDPMRLLLLVHDLKILAASKL